MEWNDTGRDYPQDVCLHKLIEQQTERTPEATALIFEGKLLSYGELNGRANHLADELRGLGVGPEVMTPICAERSLETVVGLLAILKAGGAYVPLDPYYPQDRLAFMLNELKSPVLLTQSHLSARLPQHEARVIMLDERQETKAENPASGVKAENLAYVIYTSGSTGQPKGTMNTHRGICNRLLWMQEEYRLTDTDRVLQKTPFTFDVSVWEFFWPLMRGAAGGGARGDARGQRLPDRDDPFAGDHDHAFRAVDAGCVPDGPGRGEVRRAEARHLQRRGAGLRDAAEVFCDTAGSGIAQSYGPTEAAVDVTHWKCERNAKEQTVPIGRPVANTQIHILDRAMQPVPAGSQANCILAACRLREDIWGGRS